MSDKKERGKVFYYLIFRLCGLESVIEVRRKEGWKEGRKEGSY